MAGDKDTSSQPQARWRAQHRRPTHPAAATGSTGRRLVMLVVLLLLIGGAVAYLLTTLSRTEEVVYYPLTLREYPQPLPTTAFAVQDGRSLEAFFATPPVTDYSTQNRARLQQALDRLRAENGGAVVVYVCSLAGSNGTEVSIWPGGTTTEEIDTGMPLREVLAALRQAPAKHKLLLLDVTRPVADAGIGVLADDLAERVHAQLKQADDAEPFDFLVLTACARGAEVSQVSEELESSSFAYFLKRGLAGAADGWKEASGRPDGRIQVRELAAYVHDQVDAWAQRNRGTCQRPKLWGNCEDFVLQWQLHDTEADPPADRAYPDWLYAAWKQRDAWQSLAARVEPAAYQQLETLLLAYEQRWRGGKEAAPLQQELAAQLAKWQPPTVAAPKLRPALATEVDDKNKESDTVADLRRRLVGLLEQRHEPDEYASKKTLAPKEQEQFDKDAKALNADLAKLASTDYPLAAWLLCDVIANTPLRVPLGREPFRYLHAGHASLAPKSGPRFVEIDWLDQLATLEQDTHPRSKTWFGDVARQSMRTLQLAHMTRALLVREPLACPWAAQGAFGEAETLRRAGQDLLLDAKRYGDQETPMRAKGGVLLAEAAKAYERAADQIDRVTKMLRLRDEARMRLPGWAALFSAHDAFVDGMRPWDEHVRAVRALIELLATPDKDASRLDDYPRAFITAKTTGEDMQKWLDGRIERCSKLDKANATARDYREIQALLASPLLSAKQRSALWTKGRALGQHLHATDRKPEAVEDTDLPAEYRRAERRARLAIDRLSVVDAPKADTAVASLTEQLAALRGSKDAKAWRDFGLVLGRVVRATQPASVQERWRQSVQDVEAIEPRFLPK